MRIAVQADDGDELTISADFVSVEQAIVTLEFENGLYSEIAEFESDYFNDRKSARIGRRSVVSG